MITLYLLIAVIFIIIIIFAFPKFSPIPYFPSNHKDISIIIKALDLKNNQTIIDLGAGDGLVIFNAAKIAFQKKFNTRFIATEINPILLLILNTRRLLHPNRKNIKIMCANMFNMDFSFLLTTNHSLPTTFYLYISPWFLDKTLKNIKKQIKHFEVVSYMYKLPNGVKPDKIVQGVNKVYCYNVIARSETTKQSH